MQFSEELLCWYDANKRHLPWRETKDPYLIWLSEIILQQTRVEQGLPYYLKFSKKFPTISHLASATETEVLKLWQGLGYYSRARNLHSTAKTICEHYNKDFPRQYDQVLKLKGIGKYTAAAICSFAFDQAYPVMDGNVQRVLCRIFGIDEAVNSPAAGKKLYTIAEKLISCEDPSTFNQAIMEFGAIQCKPINPDCENCFYKSKCIAFLDNRVGDLPVKTKKKKLRIRYFNYLIIRQNGKVYMQQRREKDIWQNLYEFPLIESRRLIGKKEIGNNEIWKNIMESGPSKVLSVSKPVKHILSHQEIQARFWEIDLAGSSVSKYLDSCLCVKTKNLAKFPVSRLIEKYLMANKKGGFNLRFD